MAIHEKPNKGQTDIWLTPREMVEALGPFDLDPCSQERPPWKVASNIVTESQDGLATPWNGLVWMNPPFSRVWEFMTRFIEHGNGIGLVAARTDTKWFQEVWKADALFFLKGRVRFCYADGSPGKYKLPAPVVLFAKGKLAVERLQNYAENHEGKFICLSRELANEELEVVVVNLNNGE